MTGSPSRSPIRRASTDFPAPPGPTITTRRISPPKRAASACSILASGRGSPGWDRWTSIARRPLLRPGDAARDHGRDQPDVARPVAQLALLAVAPAARLAPRRDPAGVVLALADPPPGGAARDG